MVAVKIKGLRNFKNAMAATADRVQDTATRAARATARKLNRDIIFGTPIDTGNARAHWVGSINEPDFSYTRERPPYPEGGGPATYGSTILRKANAIVATLKLGDRYYISNGLPYINRLEYGWSNQAPHGWIRQAIATMRMSWRYRFKSEFQNRHGSLTGEDISGGADLAVGGNAIDF